MKRIVSGIMVVVWLATIVGGCQTGEPLDAKSRNAAQVTDCTVYETAWMVDSEPSRAAVLNSNLQQRGMAAIVDSLTLWGYSYRQNNSIAVVAAGPSSESYPGDANPQDLTKSRPDPVLPAEWTERDTLIWQVFENPAADSGIHTAVFTIVHHGSSASAFIELNVATQNPTFIRGMILSDSGWVVNDEALTGLWSDFASCMALASARCLIGCLLSGPGYLLCLVSCEGWAATFCMLGAGIRSIWKSITNSGGD